MITLAKIYAEKELTYIHYVLWWVDIVNFCVYQFLVYVYQISNTKHTIDLSMVAGILLPNFKMGRKIKENKTWDFTNILKCGTWWKIAII